MTHNKAKTDFPKPAIEKTVDPFMLERIIEDALNEVRRFEEINFDNLISEKLGLANPRILFMGRTGELTGKVRDKLASANFQMETVDSIDELKLRLREGKVHGVMLDVGVYGTSAYSYIQDLYSDYPEVQVLALISNGDASGMLEAYRMGASLVLARPVDPRTLVNALNRVFDHRRDMLSRHMRELKISQLITRNSEQLASSLDLLRKSVGDLGVAYRDVVARLCRASHWRDDETGDHIHRIGLFSRELCRKLGMPEKEVEIVGEAAPLHDIGKIGVPDKILLKPGRLNDIEFEWMKTHTLIGAEILSGSSDPLLQAAEVIALSHHEWFNGKGYPYGLADEGIPLYGKIVTVVDVYDAMTHRRSYKRPVPLDQTIETMSRRRGIQFDPQVFDSFLEVVEDLVRIESKLESRGAHETKYSIRFGIHGMTKYVESSVANQ